MDCGDGVFCLVVANQVGFSLAGRHQRYNLPWGLHKRLAFAVELDIAAWVDHPDHSNSLSIEEHPIAVEGLPAVTPTQDGDFVGVDLAKDGQDLRREVWDLDQNPCLCSYPEHLHRAQFL